jgi:hypothetical protein
VIEIQAMGVCTGEHRNGGISHLSSEDVSPKGVEALVRERFNDAYAGVLRYLSPTRWEGRGRREGDRENGERKGGRTREVGGYG